MEKHIIPQSKDNIKNIIIQNQQRFKELNIISRSVEIENNGNYVFVGLRRVGKTYLLYQIIKENVNNIEDVLFINFEDERLIGYGYQDLNLLLEAYSELYKKKPILFLDEIQNIENWEKFVRRLCDNDYKVFVSGSNAKMLSSDISTTLGGRLFIKTISPLSFLEFLKFNNLKLKQNFEYTDQLFLMKEHYAEYIKFGGLPEVVRFKNKREYLSNIYQKLLYGDLIARFNISNQMAVKLLVKKLAESVNNETSINRIKNIIKSANIQIGNNTLFEYISHLKSSFIIHDIQNYTNKIVDRELKKKYYFADTGLLSLFLIDQNSKLLENLVFLELKRRSQDDIFYYKRNIEVDFYVPNQGLMIQVSYDISDIETRKREFKALIKAMDAEGLDSAMIITYDYAEVVEIKGKKIEVIPAWKWMLNN
ncbi:MAG: ATP-binding protein [Bacteroidetes bacterium]|nr:MAG: ATP-binding protein [Bacteroidota bacterium]